MKIKSKFKQREIGMIPEDWEVKVLKEIASYINEKISLDEINPNNFISTENMLPNKSGITIASSLPKVGKVNQFKKGDILFSNIRTYFKKFWLAKFSGGCSNDVLVIRKKSSINNKYLYYYLSQDNFFEFTVLTSKGTKMPRGDKNSIMSYEINIPSFPEQIAIAKILFDLDAKIELNEQMNKTLETLGQALFKYWFIDFEFPNEKGKPYKSSGGEMVESELGDIPEGWEVSKLGDVLSLLKDGSHNPPKRTTSGIRFIAGASDLSHFEIDFENCSYISEQDFKEMHRVWELKENDVLLTIVGTIGNIAIVKKSDLPFSLQRSIAVMRANEQISYSYLYFLLNSTNFKMFLGSRVNPTAQPGIYLGTLSKMELIIPKKNILAQYDILAKSIISFMQKKCAETRNLIQLRDSLLPRLMSGKIRVPV